MLELLHGDCLLELWQFDGSSIDSVVTDPPYGLKFMGKQWDYDVPSVDVWREVLRVLKPGGYLLSFGGTRTYHRMVVAIEDAGFEIRDQIQWLYGSGFPKSLNISKAIDKAAGAEREYLGEGKYSSRKPTKYSGGNALEISKNDPRLGHPQTAPATDDAKQWDGYGTALKPANEPIVLARKPLSEKTVAANVLKWGVGGLNIDGCRVETSDITGRKQYESKGWKNTSSMTGSVTDDWKKGRFPANVILDESVAAMLDKQSLAGGMHSAGKYCDRHDKTSKHNGVEFLNSDGALRHQTRIGDTGGASRFFYCAKASKRERGEGNKHPTVKPIKLMQYLCRLVTPAGGIVLDPFMGSGTTGIAAIHEGFGFIGVERDSDSFETAKRRVGALDFLT